MTAATPSRLLQAAFLAAALALAQLLWANHEAKAIQHEAAETCDVCLVLANVGNALVDIAPPLPVQDLAVVKHRPTGRSPVGVLARGWHARAPPRDRA